MSVVMANRGTGAVLARCGGIGGAKLALGLYHELAPGQLVVAVNTGDDFEHLGLCVSPDETGGIGMPVLTTRTLMHDLADRKQLTGEAIAFADNVALRDEVVCSRRARRRPS